MVLLFSYIVFFSISVHSIMVTWSPPHWSTIWKSRQALHCSLVSPELTSLQQKMPQKGRRVEEEDKRRGGEEGRKGGRGRWWHNPAQTTQEKDLSLGLVIMF